MPLWSNSFWICCSFVSFSWRFPCKCYAYLIRDRLTDANISFEISVVLGVRLLAIICSLTRRWAVIDSWLMLTYTRFLFILNPRSTEAFPWFKLKSGLFSKPWKVPFIYQYWQLKNDWLRQLSLSTGDIIFLLIIWFSNFHSFFLFDSTVFVAMREGINKRQDLTITDPNGRFSHNLFNTEVTNNLHPFLETLTETRVISTHFLRRCTSLDAKNPDITNFQ